MKTAEARPGRRLRAEDERHPERARARPVFWGLDLNHGLGARRWAMGDGRWRFYLRRPRRLGLLETRFTYG
ncbi:hypothetical protein IF1G_04847 [Cordyceps javanica]|uniref:Uncharacterized protein n=1 Tax=Cordyceps javanica TaxID=43265 RepID=A0A545V3I0_9HYPO|nr:hypothetical protein IF1G_04847 [Cordyceps javanica]